MARRLAAILAADVVGYSRLMAADEAGTHARLKALQADIIGPLVAELHGRIVKLMGDGALVEFPSVVEAVQCAVDVQRGVAEHQGKLPEDQRIAFRIGVNLGDVIIEGDDIHGDGVNVAARLESLADPGGVLISRTVRDHVQDKLPYRFEDLGERRVKNIPRPVHVFCVVADGAAAVAPGRMRAWSIRWAWAAAAAIALLLVGTGGAWLWHKDQREPVPQRTLTPVTASTAPVATSQPPLDKYRIAVLPFTNMSADAENEYFSDGMTEELISKLSRVHDLTVIARTSIMQYKKTEKGIAEIGRELQAGTILEGSVRKAGDRLRITAQLVDVESEGHLWSEDYDRELTDVFAIQSDVAQHVAEALQITLKPAETRQIAKAGTDDLEAYNAYLQGLYHYNTWSTEGLEKSIDYFEQAIARDPDFAKAYAAMAFSYVTLGENGHLPLDDAFPRVKEAARRALAIDATTAEAWTALAVAASYYDYDWIRADEGFRRALELNPNSAAAHDWYGHTHLSPLGRHDEAIAHGKRAKELDPITPYIRVSLGWYYDHARRWDEAIAECEQIPDIDPNFYFTYWCLGFAYVNKGMYEEAIAAYERGVALEPEDLGLKAHLGIAYRAAGMEDRAQKILEEIKEKARREYVEPTEMALANIAVGNTNEALMWLEKAYEEHSTWLIFMNEHASFDSLRGDPRFQQLLRKVGFKELKFIPEPASD